MKLRFVQSCVLAVLLGAGAIVTSAPASAEEASGIRYAQIPAGAYSIVAEVRAKAGKEAELRAVTLPLIAQVDRKSVV